MHPCIAICLGLRHESGDKPTLWGRCRLHHKVASKGLSAAGADPTQLKPAELRKAAAQVP